MPNFIPRKDRDTAPDTLLRRGFQQHPSFIAPDNDPWAEQARENDPHKLPSISDPASALPGPPPVPDAQLPEALRQLANIPLVKGSGDDR